MTMGFAINFIRQRALYGSLPAYDYPGEQRDVSAMTLGITQDQLPDLKKKVQEFRREILKFVATDEHPDTVVQLNMQLFPVNRIPEEKAPAGSRKGKDPK